MQVANLTTIVNMGGPCIVNEFFSNGCYKKVYENEKEAAILLHWLKNCQVFL